MIALLSLLVAAPVSVSVTIPQCADIEAQVRSLVPDTVSGRVEASLDAEGELIVELRTVDGALVGVRRMPADLECDERAHTIAMLAEAWSLELALMPMPVHVPAALPPPMPKSKARARPQPAPAVELAPVVVPQPPRELERPRLSLRPIIDPPTPVFADVPPVEPSTDSGHLGLMVVGVGALAGGVGASMVDTGQPFTNTFLPLALFTSGFTMVLAALIVP